MNPIYTITQNGATKFWGNVRHVFTNGDLPDITDSLILDGSPLAWPKSPFDMAANSHVDQINDNYTALFNLNPTHGIAITDNPTPQSLVSNPTSNPDASVLRHFQVAGSAPGVGVELNENQHQGTGVGQHAKVYGNANLQDMVISGWGGDGVRITNTINNIVGGSGATQSVSIQQVSGTGVNIIGSLSTGNLVQQTFIGILPTGGSGFGAGGNGIWIQGANNNTIGGFATNTGDQIQASAANGIYILNSSGTRVQRSVIGDPTDFFPNKSDASSSRIHPTP